MKIDRSLARESIRDPKVLENAIEYFAPLITAAKNITFQMKNW